ncbi:MAG: CDF family Co(II)/Ni(II) efflux transporter DmeF [Geminicoccaceae bacterium]|nr:CDF family Co(II)/Ni(II) efflux transporter DmeF [Geminicoccaceae bacterium]MCX8100944.1 CDF family Co(II)/Ni(II) efflux transporter DmeF [Geminicoccaceae bacterium]
MHTVSLDPWRQEHRFLGRDHARNERRLWLVVGLSAATMLVEIAAGLWFGSMALLADGVHMATHAGALGLSAFAYLLARRLEDHPRLSFGTGKLGDLAAWSSALLLAAAAVWLLVEAIGRFLAPVPIAYDEALVVAVLGLVVNLGCLLLLGGAHDHEHGHEHQHAQEHDHEHGHDRDRRGGARSHAHHDHNFRAAVAHVLADALTSLLAIAALLAGRELGWSALDPAVALLGAAMILHWAYRLLRASGAVLLDASPDPGLEQRIRGRLEQGSDRIADFHLWRLGPGHLGLLVSLVSDRPEPPAVYKARLADLPHLAHVTIEVHRCADRAPA